MDKVLYLLGNADRKITELSEPRPYFGYQVSVQSYPRIHMLCVSALASKFSSFCRHHAEKEAGERYAIAKEFRMRFVVLPTLKTDI